MGDLDVRTTAGETFTDEEHRDLARLIHKRFGRDDTRLVAAWAGLFEQVTPDRAAILALLKPPIRYYSTPGGGKVTDAEARKMTCTGTTPCPSCDVGEDDAREHAEQYER